MKKFYTLFMGLMIVLSAVAAPQFSLRSKTVKKAADVQRVEKKVAKAPAQANGKVVNIEANNLMVDDSYADLGIVTVTGGTAVWDVEAWLYLDDDAVTYYGEYDDEGMSLYLTDLTNDDPEAYIMPSISSAKLEKTADGDRFTAVAVDEDGVTYNVTLTFIVPDEPKDTIALEFGAATFLKFYAETGDYYITAERADYALCLDFYSDELAGIYTNEDFDTYYTTLYSIKGKDTVAIGGFYDASAIIAEANGVYDIKAELFMTDSILYQVHLTYTKPVAADTIYHKFAEPVNIDKFDGDFYFRAVDAEYVLMMDYNSKTITGKFTLADMYEEYCALFAINGKDTTHIEYEDLGLVVKEDSTGYDIQATYFGKDSHYYVFALRSNFTVAEDTVQITLDNADYQSMGAAGMYYGFNHYVLAAPADSSIVVAMAVKGTNFAGSFTDEDLNPNYSGVQIGKDFYQIASAEFTVSAAESGSYKLEGWMLAKNNVLYEFTITTKTAKGIEDVVLSEQAQKVIVDGVVYIIRDNKMYNLQGVQVR